METELCPCNKCLCKPICRHKRYFMLLRCPLLEKLYLEFPIASKGGYAPHVIQKKILFKALNPTAWTMDEKGWIVE